VLLVYLNLLLTRVLQCLSTKFFLSQECVKCITLYGLSSGAAGHGWRKDLDDGDVAIVVHNPGEATQAGFAPDTQIHVRDMLEQKDLGWMRGSWKNGSVLGAARGRRATALVCAQVPAVPALAARGEAVRAVRLLGSRGSAALCRRVVGERIQTCLLLEVTLPYLHHGRSRSIS
jgi:hypothetical protein